MKESQLQRAAEACMALVASHYGFDGAPKPHVYSEDPESVVRGYLTSRGWQQVGFDNWALPNDPAVEASMKTALRIQCIRDVSPIWKKLRAGIVVEPSEEEVST